MQSKKAYELRPTGKPDAPAFPHAMVFTVSFVISPVIGLCCHRRLANWSAGPGRADTPPRDLTPASRRQDHTTLPSAHALFVDRALGSLTGDPPCNPLCAPALPRPSHPAPRS